MIRADDMTGAIGDRRRAPRPGTLEKAPRVVDGVVANQILMATVAFSRDTTQGLQNVRWRSIL
jgi:hypothetical protein